MGPRGHLVVGIAIPYPGGNGEPRPRPPADWSVVLSRVFKNIQIILERCVEEMRQERLDTGTDYGQDRQWTDNGQERQWTGQTMDRTDYAQWTDETMDSSYDRQIRKWTFEKTDVNGQHNSTIVSHSTANIGKQPRNTSVGYNTNRDRKNLWGGGHWANIIFLYLEISEV